MSDPRNPPTTGAQIMQGTSVDEKAKAFYDKEIAFFAEIERLVKQFYVYDQEAGKYTKLRPSQDFVVEGKEITTLQQHALDVMLEPYRDLVNEKSTILKSDQGIPESDYLARLAAVTGNERYNELLLACMESADRLSEFKLKDVLKSISINPDQPQRIQTVNSIISRPAGHLIEIKDFGKAIHKLAGKNNNATQSLLAATIHNQSQEYLSSYETSHIDYRTKIRDLISDLGELVKKMAKQDTINHFTKLKNEVEIVNRKPNMSEKEKYESMLSKVNFVMRMFPELSLPSLQPPESLEALELVPTSSEMMTALNHLALSEPQYISDLDVTDSLFDSIRRDIRSLGNDYIDDKTQIIERLFENLMKLEKRTRYEAENRSMPSLPAETMERKELQLALLVKILPHKAELLKTAKVTTQLSEHAENTAVLDPKGKGKARDDRTTEHLSQQTAQTFRSNVSSTTQLLKSGVGMRDTKDRAARSSKHRDEHHKKASKKIDTSIFNEAHTTDKPNKERVSFQRPSTTGKKKKQPKQDAHTIFSESQSTDKLTRPPTKRR